MYRLRPIDVIMMNAEIEAHKFDVAPSKIDENAEVACPFFKREDKTFSTIYARQHAQVTSYLMARLQERFHNVLIEGEAQLTSGARGFVDLKFVSSKSKILVENDGQVLCALEVKTGSVKICQPAFYAVSEDVPVLLVEAKTGDVFVVTPEAAQGYLKVVGDVFRAKSVLESRGIYCPSSYCRYCANIDCGHQREGYRRKNVISFLLDDNLRAFSRNLPIIIEKVSKFLEKLLHEQNEGLEQIPASRAEVGGNGR